MKAYTDLEQSKKLAEILPIESADMWWLYVSSQGKHIAMMYEEPDPHYLARMEGYGIKDAAIRCWSLAALLGVIPYNVTFNKAVYRFKLVKFPNHWECYHENFGTVSTEIFKEDNPIDACYEMILKLNELKML